MDRSKDAQDVPSPLPPAALGSGRASRRYNWKAMLGNRNAASQPSKSSNSSDVEQEPEKPPPKWSLGILNDTQTDEVPGSVLLLSKVSEYNEPLGLRNQPVRRPSVSSLPSPYPPSRSSSRRRTFLPEKKRTPDGRFVLDPQPDDSANDPLNWAVWRRDAALFSLGFYCMVGGGMTPILAAGFHNVAETFDVSLPRVALTTGLYMMGLGIGSVLLSPTAILYGKRPVYLVAAICFVLTSIWCALSPNYTSLVVARIFQGIAVSSVECLPSATVAEIYFLHEKAYRLGIYTLLLLGGKNLVPLVSAAIIGSLGWRWVFYIVAIIVGFAGCLLFFFVPETFWDRTPRPHKPRRMPSFRRFSSSNIFHHKQPKSPGGVVNTTDDKARDAAAEGTKESKVADFGEGEKHHGARRIHFGEDENNEKPVVVNDEAGIEGTRDEPDSTSAPKLNQLDLSDAALGRTISTTPQLTRAPTERDYFGPNVLQGTAIEEATPSIISPVQTHQQHDLMSPMSQLTSAGDIERGAVHPPQNIYTKQLRRAPTQTFVQQLRPYSGRINHANWFKVMLRPFILYAYPSILWSAMLYSLSVGWLIVLSESVADIYQNPDTYHFTPLQTGLVYISPFVGGILGTAVAGKVSDLIVRYMARKNDGVYEPEFRLVMTIPILITTSIGLMGYGWSAQDDDAWIVPTIFFGFISFGCSLGSTTAITFAVDSYRQYAGEALVTLNFSKNILHGLVFSLFFNHWLDAEGPKNTFLAIGGIQIALLLLTIPMYLYGKRARMWTVRQNLMERF